MVADEAAALMDLPAWVEEEIEKYEAPETGKVVLEIERYMGGITKIEIGGLVRVKPPNGKRMTP